MQNNKNDYIVVIRNAGNTGMKSSESKVVVFIILAAIVSCVMFYGPAASYADSFMDLELSIKELEQIVKKTSPGVAMVVAYDDSGEESGRGSGFFIDSKGVLITNASIMKDAYSAEVISESNQYGDVIILHCDNALDIALIQVKAADEMPLELAFEYEIKPGERVAVIGKSPDLKKTVSEGLISSIGGKSEILEIQTTKPLLSFRESKDGPLLNMSGKVIGVMSTAIHDSQDIDVIPRMPDYQNFKAISIASIRQFISRPDKAEHLPHVKSKIWSRWLVKWLTTSATAVFIALYMTGFPKLMAIAFIIILIISAIQWLFIKLKKGQMK